MQSLPKTALFAFALIAFSLKQSEGLYAFFPLMVMIAGCLLLASTLRSGPMLRSDTNLPVLNLAIAGLYCFYCYQAWLNPAIAYGTSGPVVNQFQIALSLSLLASALLVLFVFGKADGDRRPQTLAFGIAFGLLVITRLFIPTIAPRPFIDTFVQSNLASDYLLKGENPYSAEYPDIYQGYYDYPQVFGYWTGYLYWAAPFRWVLGDVRYGHVLAEALTGIFILGLARQWRLPQSTARLAALLWLSNPIGLHVVESCWIEPVIMLYIAAMVYWLQTARWRLAGAAMGCICATKVNMPVIPLFALVALWPANRKAFWQSSLAMLATCALLFVPFLIIDADSFVFRGLRTLFSASLRLDALSIQALLARSSLPRPPDAAVTFLYVAILAACLWHTWRSSQFDCFAFLGPLAVFYSAFFLLGKWAFCNYYYFLGLLVLLHTLHLFSRAFSSAGKPGEEPLTAARSLVGHTHRTSASASAAPFAVCAS